MAQLPITHLETHPDGTTGIAGIVNGNWERLEALFNPGLSNADASYGFLWKALVRDPTTPSNAQAVVWDTALGRPKFGSVGGQSIQAAIAALGPYCYWQLNETSGTVISDSSGNSRHGTIAGTYTLNQAGPTIRNGASPAIAMTAARILAGSTWNHTDFTIMAWVKPTGAIPTAHSPCLFCQRETTSTRYSFAMGSSRQQLEAWNGSGSGNAGISPGVNMMQIANEWHHIAIVRKATNPSNVVFYFVNGVNRGTAAFTLGAVTDKPFAVGAVGSAYQEPWVGSIAHVAYFDKGLSETQIHSVFAATP